MSSRTMLPSAVLVLALVALGGADYFIKERVVPLVPPDGSTDQSSSESSLMIPDGSSSSAESSAMAIQSSSAASGVPKGVSRRMGPAVKELLVERGYTWAEYNESTLIDETIGSGSIQKLVILRANDRAAGLAWIENADIKDMFNALKGAIQQSFSGNVTDIVDETVRPADGAPHDILAFRDPGISAERIVFARIRTRLYEFHVVDGHEQEISDLISELARR